MKHIEKKTNFHRKNHSSLWILKSSRKNSANQKSLDCCQMFVFSKPNPEVICTVSLAIGFKQMLFTSRLAIGFKRCFGFLKPEAFFPSNITTGSLNAQSFSIYVNNYFFSIFWDILIASYEFAKKFKKLLVKELCSCRKWKPCFSCCMCVCMHKWIGGGRVAGDEEYTHIFIICLIKFNLHT
jgi:hypothetical protein